MGRITEINKKSNEILKRIYQEKGIISCELRFPGCWRSNHLGFAHKEKRRKYYSCPEKLSEFRETILACPVCHDAIEYDRELTISVFKKLRNNDDIVKG